MVSQNVDKILQETKSLTLEERQQFLQMFQAQHEREQSQLGDDRVAEALFRKGLIRKIPRKLTPEEIAEFNAWKPIKIEGRPLSEILIEERR